MRIGIGMVGRARSEMSSGRLDGQLDRAIGKRLLGNGMTGPASFKPGLFDRIGLKKSVEVFLLTPLVLEIVVADVAVLDVDHGGILPARQAHHQPCDFATEKLGSALHGLREPQPPARRRHGDGITKFGLNLDDVANGNSP